MHLQVGILNIQRQFETLALNGARKRCRDVQVQRIAKFIAPRRSAGFDAGGHVAGVMAAKTRLPERSHEIAQHLVPKKVQALVGDLKLCLLLRLPDLCAYARTRGGIVRLINTDVVLPLHALDQLVDQLVERSIHLHLLELLAHFLAQHITFEQGLLNSAAQILERLLTLRKRIIQVILEAALQQEIRKRAEQILEAHFARRIGNVFAIADAFHRSSLRSRASSGAETPGPRGFSAAARSRERPAV